MLVQGSSRSCGSFPLALQHQMAGPGLVSAFLYMTGGTARPRGRGGGGGGAKVRGFARLRHAAASPGAVFVCG